MKLFQITYKKTGYLMIFLAASIWGSLGVLGKIAYQEGFAPLELMIYRSILASLVLAIILLIYKPGLYIIDIRDIPFFLVYGTLSVGIFYLLYFSSLLYLKVGVASALLYTAPFFVVIMSRIIFKEPISFLKIFALISTITGVILLGKVFPLDNLNILMFKGLMYGLGSGFTYALYTIFGKKALTKYSPATLIFYTLISGSLTLVLFLILKREPLNFLLTPKAILSVVLLSLITTLLAYYLYVEGLKRVEAGRASILSTIEPVVAWGLGFIFLGEQLTLLEGFGLFMILIGASIVVSN